MLSRQKSPARKSLFQVLHWATASLVSLSGLEREFHDAANMTYATKSEAKHLQTPTGRGTAVIRAQCHLYQGVEHALAVFTPSWLA
jgi:hypothetical protein